MSRPTVACIVLFQSSLDTRTHSNVKPSVLHALQNVREPHSKSLMPAPDLNPACRQAATIALEERDSICLPTGRPLSYPRPACPIKRPLEPGTGIEPVTSSLPRTRSTT